MVTPGCRYFFFLSISLYTFMQWSRFIFQNVAHSIFFLMAGLSWHTCFCLGTTSQNISYLTIQLLKIEISDQPQVLIRVPVVSDGHTHYTITEPFGNAFY